MVSVMETLRRMKNRKWVSIFIVVIIMLSYTGIQNNAANLLPSKAKLNNSGNINWNVNLSLGTYGSINLEVSSYAIHSYNPIYGINAGDTITLESVMEKGSCKLEITLDNLPGLDELEGTYRISLDSTLGEFYLQIPGLTMENPDVGKVSTFLAATISAEDQMALSSGNITFIEDNYTFHDNEGSEFIDVKIGQVNKGDIVSVQSTYYLILTDVSIQFKDQLDSILFIVETIDTKTTQKSSDTIRTDIEIGKPVPPPPIDPEMILFWAAIIILAVLAFITLHRRISP